MPLPWQTPFAKGIVDPRSLPGLALWVDGKDVSSQRNDSGTVPTTGQSIKLLSDKSGNSGVNVLCLNGVAGNYASAPDSAALSITGDIDVRAYVALSDWTPGADNYIFGKYNGVGAGNTSYTFRVTTTGALVFAWSPTGDLANIIQKTSTVSVAASDFAGIWIRATLDVDNGATQNEVKFYTSTDSYSTTSPTWVQLGTTVTTAGVTSIADTARILEVGSIVTGTLGVLTGQVYRAQIRNNILDNGTGIQFDANFTAQSKLATSFTESSVNAATVTINTSGATGARISGARDLYQGTAANQPILTIAGAGNYLTFDGSNDYLKAAAFALAQPETVYFVGQQVTWTDIDKIYDGNTPDSILLNQTTFGGGVSPRIGFYAGGLTLTTDAMALGVNSIITTVANGTSGAIRYNRTSAVTGNAGSQAGNGFTLGARADASRAGNITASEVLIYSAAHDKATQDRVILYLSRKWGIAA